MLRPYVAVVGFGLCFAVAGPHQTIAVAGSYRCFAVAGLCQSIAVAGSYQGIALAMPQATQAQKPLQGRNNCNRVFRHTQPTSHEVFVSPRYNNEILLYRS